MSLHPCPSEPIPDETARVARAAFPKGNRDMTMRDVLGVIDTEAPLTDLYRPVGQHGEPPWRLALVTLMQCSENLTDRQAADAVRGRMDWQYALGLALTDPGFDFSILSELRTRLIAGAAEERLLTTRLTGFRERGLLKDSGEHNGRIRPIAWPPCAPSTVERSSARRCMPPCMSWPTLRQAGSGSRSRPSGCCATANALPMLNGPRPNAPARPSRRLLGAMVCRS